MHAVDVAAATNRLLRLLAVPGVTGEESLIGKAIVTELRKVGVPAKAIRFDTANKRIPVPTQTGNLIVQLPGKGKLARADRVLFMDQGQVLERATPEDFFQRPQHPRAQRFLADIRSPWSEPA